MLKKVQTIFNNQENSQQEETYESVQQQGDDQQEENKVQEISSSQPENSSISETIPQEQKIAQSTIIKPSTIYINPQKDYMEINIKLNQEWSKKLDIKEQLPKYKKGQEVFINQPIFFVMEKEYPKHPKGFFSQIFTSSNRFILMQDFYFYTLSQISNDNFKVKSLQQFKNLFKIIIKQKEIIFCFFNQFHDKKQLPKAKKYLITQGADQKNRILLRIRSQVNKLGYDFEII